MWLKESLEVEPPAWNRQRTAPHRPLARPDGTRDRRMDRAPAGAEAIAVGGDQAIDREGPKNGGNCENLRQRPRAAECV